MTRFSVFGKAAMTIATLFLVFVTGCHTVTHNTSNTSSTPNVSTADSAAMKAVYGKYGVSVSRRAGDLLYIGGLVAFNDDGSVFAPGDGVKQLEVIYARLQKILAMHGASLKDVVRENSFVTDWEEFFKGAPIRIGAYDAAGAEYPAATAVQVVSLAEQGIIAEMDFIAYLGR